jgi:hypothetical protein
MYEMPVNSLDFTISKKIGKHILLRAGIQNLINQNIRFLQTVVFEKPGEGTVKREQPTLTFQAGRYYTVGIGLGL